MKLSGDSLSSRSPLGVSGVETLSLSALGRWLIGREGEEGSERSKVPEMGSRVESSPLKRSRNPCSVGSVDSVRRLLDVRSTGGGLGIGGWGDVANASLNSASLTLILLRFVPLDVVRDAGGARIGVTGGDDGRGGSGVTLSTNTMDLSSKSSPSRIVEGEWTIGGKGLLESGGRGTNG